MQKFSNKFEPSSKVFEVLLIVFNFSINSSFWACHSLCFSNQNSCEILPSSLSVYKLFNLFCNLEICFWISSILVSSYSDFIFLNSIDASLKISNNPESGAGIFSTNCKNTSSSFSSLI
ncbi:hypothetical protein IJD34_07555 [bacterium]|nr:hypothetical protein [bacterium]